MQKTSLIAIVAADLNNGIGCKNQLPWHLPEDFRFFKRQTLGFPVIMGRKTFDSIGKPLPGRVNMVLSKQNLSLPEGVKKVSSFEDALQSVYDLESEKAFVIGGAEIYRLFLPHCQKVLLTRVNTRIEADAFFPHLNPSEWELTSLKDHDSDEKHAFGFSFQTYERKG